jgi:hypothetical protein
VTKGTGRQRLSCTSCGRTFLVRDAAEAPPAASSPPTTVKAAPAPEPSATVPVVGGVEVLEPATLSISRPTFPPPTPPEPSGPAPRLPADPLPPAAELETEPEADPPAPAPPVSVGPGRKVGYYGRVTGRG